MYLMAMSSREEVMEWSRELTIKLIKELEQRRCLWDRFDKFHKNKAVKRKHLKEIASNLGVDATEIDKKRMSLKTQYHRELTRIMNSKRSGCPPDEVYVSKWYAFKHMNFLMNTTKPGINLRRTYLQEAIMNSEIVPERHFGNSVEDVISAIDFNFTDSASRNNSYSIEDSPVKANYVCAEDSIIYAEPLPCSTGSVDEPENTSAEEVRFVQPVCRKRSQSEGNQPSSGISSQNNWINKNDVNVIQSLPKRVSLTRERETEGLNFGQSAARKKAYSERHQASSVTNSTENILPGEDVNFVHTLPRRRTIPGRNPVFEHTSSCSCSKDSRDVHSSFGEYVAQELRTMHDPVALLLLKKKITDAIFESKMNTLRGPQRISSCMNQHRHPVDSTPEPSPDASRSSEISLEHRTRNNEDDIKQEIIGENWVFTEQ